MSNSNIISKSVLRFFRSSADAITIATFSGSSLPIGISATYHLNIRNKIYSYSSNNADVIANQGNVNHLFFGILLRH
ncbi:42689_t:CDS:2 [Gigaspora margarita]|uniref:42689_t:CDS:1 n=1 Tax=Gigaspora margarita TaxID=4874 RepID=A0ABM8VYN7_GIGMA|nr:42689_t:CDS:2 [Gigaspora margarita]